MHEVQKRIIQSLLFSPELKYSVLKGEDLESDRFWFHLKTLIKEGFIEKREDTYSLTELGKLQAHDFDNITLKEIVKPLTMVAIVVKYNDTYLLTKRIKAPFYGYYGFPGGKVEFSETLENAGKRVLKNETGIEVPNFKLIGIQHEMNVNKNKEIVRDAYIYLMSGEITELKKEILTKEGEPIFVTSKTFSEFSPRFGDVDSFFDHENGSLFFEEFVTDQQP